MRDPVSREVWEVESNTTFLISTSDFYLCIHGHLHLPLLTMHTHTHTHTHTHSMGRLARFLHILEDQEAESSAQT